MKIETLIKMDDLKINRYIQQTHQVGWPFPGYDEGLHIEMKEVYLTVGYNDGKDLIRGLIQGLPRLMMRVNNKPNDHSEEHGP